MKIFLLLFLLISCNMPDRHDVDQCLRREIFAKCMAALPKGPNQVVNNDWDEVVDSCESAAYYQSLRPLSLIKQECRP